MFRYYRQQLSRSELNIYDEIYAGLSRWDTTIYVGRVNMDRAMEIYSLVLLDTPEFFYTLPSVSARSVGSSVSLFPVYSMSQLEMNRCWSVIDNRVYDYKTTLSPVASDYEKVEKAYEYLIKLCEYGTTPNDQNMCSALVDEISCCTGYSKAFLYLLSTVGVNALVVTGDASSKKRGSGPHAWNGVEVDGRWYWCDATWGDPVMRQGEKKLSEVIYDYLCLTTKDMKNTHTPDRFIMKLLPTCNTTGGDWYSRHHLFFDVYDSERVAKALQGDVLAREIGYGRDMDGDAYLRFSSHRALEAATEELARKNGIYKVLYPVYKAYDYSISNFAYSSNEQLLTLHMTYDIFKNT